MLSEADKAYLAGLIDGEGCITISKTAGTHFPCYTLQLIIAMTDEPIISWVQEATGVGAISIKHPATPNSKPAFRWYVSSTPAASIIAAVLPYLKVKSKQAELGLEFMDTCHLGSNYRGRIHPELTNKREQYCQAFRVLNKRGI